MTCPLPRFTIDGRIAACHVEEPLTFGVDHLLPVLNLAFVDLREPACRGRALLNQDVDCPPFLREGPRRTRPRKPRLADVEAACVRA